MSHNKGDRKWLRESKWDEDQRKHISCHPIQCSACPRMHRLPDHHTKQLPFNIVERRLREVGWTVGRNQSDDLCPTCTDKAALERRQKRNGTKPVLVTTPPTNVVSFHTHGAPTMDTNELLPAVMTRDDRRTIFAYLNDVYTDASTGYKAPWTDRAVADHLNVPVNWVAMLREENFGPARDNAEIRDLLTKSEKATEAAAALVEEARKASNDAHSAVTKLKDIQNKLDAMSRQLHTLNAAAASIRKAVTP